MVIGCCSIKFYLHGNNSLKGKRRVVRAIKDRLKNDFNVSVAEVGDQDVWQSLHIGISAVGSDSPYMDGLLTKVVDAIDRMNLAEMVDCKTETLSMGQEIY
ncbi:MAG: DUF503 domain-containing protein [Nitrospinae bacterium]|nr:DUF503 domain-containing protein [Nitrospinota bacterium]MZH05422.1 DUF503 domain-containing protein [Nitrospinota bacterium]MZH13300.1 DUF503 domain-containing protein [Nitrospinota bacterium]